MWLLFNGTANKVEYIILLMECHAAFGGRDPRAPPPPLPIAYVLDNFESTQEVTFLRLLTHSLYKSRQDAEFEIENK